MLSKYGLNKDKSFLGNYYNLIMYNANGTSILISHDYMFSNIHTIHRHRYCCQANLFLSIIIVPIRKMIGHKKWWLHNNNFLTNIQSNFNLFYIYTYIHILTCFIYIYIYMFYIYLSFLESIHCR